MRLRVAEEFVARIVPYACGSFLLGIIGFYAIDRHYVGLVWIFIGFALISTLYCIRERMGMVMAITILFCAWYGGTGLVRSYEDHHSTGQIAFDKSIEVRGHVISQPDRRYDKQYVVVQPDSAPYRIRARLELDQKVVVGDRVSIVGVIRKPEQFESQGGVMFDYPRYLMVDSVVAVMPKVTRFEVLGTEEGYRVSRVLSLARSGIESVIVKSVPIHALGLAVGTTLGSAEYITPDMIDTYRVTGLSHIIVLSGFNISIIAVAVSWIMSRIGARRTPSVLVSIGILWLFVVMVGFGGSIIRAGIMTSMVLLAGVLDRDTSNTRSLLYTLVIFCLGNPRILVDDIGFQLSVLATAGLLIVLPALEKYIFAPKALHPVVRAIQEIYLATCAVLIVTTPYLYFKLGSVSAFGLLSNMLVVWVVPFIMVGVLLVLVLSVIPMTSVLIGTVVGLLAKYVDSVASVIARISPAETLLSMMFMLSSVVVLYVLLSGLRSRFGTIAKAR